MANWNKTEIGYELSELNSIFGYELAGVSLSADGRVWELTVYGKNDLVGKTVIVGAAAVPDEYVLMTAELVLRRQFGCLI